MNAAAGSQPAQFSYHAALNAKKKAICPLMDSPSSAKSSSSCASPSPASRFCSNITQMNQDQLISILQLLPVESLISLSMTCRKFRFLGSSDALWETICRREWGSGQVDALLRSFSSPERRRTPWKTLYRRVSHLASVSCFRLDSEDGILPRPRASHSLNCVSGCLVLFGGGCEGGRHLDDTWVAFVGDGVGRLVSWQPLKSGTPTPSGRFGHSCTVVGNWIILFGGINDNGIRQNDTWIGQVIRDGSLDISLSWTFLDVSSVAPPPRGAHAACCIRDEKLVIHGGIGLNGIRLDDMWVLDLSSGLSSASWHLVTTVTKSSQPSARSGHTLTWIDGEHMVLFGGRGKGYEALNDVWLFNLSGQCLEWQEVMYDRSSAPSQSPLPRVGHSATPIIGGRVLIYGGEDSYRHRKDDFWLLDLCAILKTNMKVATMTMSKKELSHMWKKLQTEGQLPESRSFHAACTDISGRNVYLFGGMVDGVVHPADAYGLRFDNGLYLVDLVV